MVCSLPLSKIRKSFWVRLRTTSPFSSRAVTGAVTSVTRTRRGLWAAGMLEGVAPGGGDCSGWTPGGRWMGPGGAWARAAGERERKRVARRRAIVAVRVAWRGGGKGGGGRRGGLG